MVRSLVLSHTSSFDTVMSMSTTAKQIIKFGIIGVANTVIDMLIYLALTRFTEYFSEHYLAAATIAFFIAGAHGYLWNKYWTFRDPTAISSKQVAQFYIASGIGLFTNQILLWMVVSNFGQEYDIYGKIIASGGAAVVNFIVQRLWTFRHVHHMHVAETTTEVDEHIGVAESE